MIEDIKKFLDEALEIGEDEHIEFKEAKNDFPKDALETISAFANTDGGYLIFGFKEIKEDVYRPEGVKNIKKVKNRMYDLLLQSDVINYNPVDFDNIIDHKFNYEGKVLDVMIIPVPKVSYRYKPIYLRGNDRFTYIRRGSADYICDRKVVEMMIRDSMENSFDSSTLSGYSIDDLDLNTIQKYRFKFEEEKPEHPFLKYSNEEFLIKINALRKSRYNGKVEPTVAGLLVFGKHSSIKEFLPHYNVEYINKIGYESNYGFKDRLIYDGSWGEDNLYNFFLNCSDRIYLTVNESSEIQTDSITRKSSDKFKIAIREALVNSIIHCDFQVELGIIITRYNDNIDFLNGGSLRISKLDFFKGGHSKPRNNFIQEIFRHINLCEKAGTGVPKIMDAVKYNDYRYPSIFTEIDKFEFVLWDISILDSLNLENDTEKEIMKIIISNKVVTVDEITDKLGVHKNTSYKYLNSLEEKKIITHTRMGNKYAYSLVIDQNYGKYNLIDAMYSMLESIRKRI